MECSSLTAASDSVSRTTSGGSGCSKMLAMVASAWSVGSISDKSPSSSSTPPASLSHCRRGWAYYAGLIKAELGLDLHQNGTHSGAAKAGGYATRPGFASAEHVLIDDVLPDQLNSDHT